MADVRLRIGATGSETDRTSSLIFPPDIDGGWSCDCGIGPEIGTFDFTLDDPTNALSLTRGHDVLFDDPDNAATIRHFGGILVDLDYFPYGVGRRIRCVAQDWKILLDKATFSKTYVAQTDQAIIQDIFTSGVSGLTEIDTTNVGGTRTIDRIDFKGVSVRSALDTIREITGWIWYLDMFKNLYYEQEGTTEHAFGLSDVPNDTTLLPYQSPHYIPQLGQYNSVEVRGGRALSDDVQEAYPGDGTETLFIVGVHTTGRHAISVHPTTSSRVEVDVNTNTDGSPTWTSQDVGLEGRDTLGVLGIDVLWNPTTRTLEFNTAPPNFANNSWRIKGRYYYDIVGIAKDEAAIASQGREYKKVLTMPEVDDEDIAYDLALGYLREHGNKEIFKCMMDHDWDVVGPRIGYTVEVTATFAGLTNVLFTITGSQFKALSNLDNYAHELTLERVF